MRQSLIIFLPILVLLSILPKDPPILVEDLSAQTIQAENLALGKPVTVITNGSNDNRENPGLYPSDITDGSLYYRPSSLAQEDGTVGYVNNDYNQLMIITVTIDLQGIYDVSRIRYNMGHVERANTWNADSITTPFGTSGTAPGTPYQGAWTEQTGSATLSSVTIILEKTRVSFPTDWLFIGEIEIYGTPSGPYQPTFDLPFGYPNRGSATESDFVSAWMRCTTSFFDHNLPGEKVAGDGFLWFWTGDKLPGTKDNCELFRDCYDGHEGYDFDDIKSCGRAVYPAAEGEIVPEETGWKDDGYGNRVVIQHGDSGYKTLYGHLASIELSTGSVEASTKIGVIGETGCPGCGSHLHFNVYYNGMLVDPSGWDGNFPDPNEEQNGAKSHRQWLFPVQRLTPVSSASGTVLVAPSGNSVARIPANAYSQDFELSITELAPIGLPIQLSSSGHGMVLAARDINGNAVEQLEKNFTVEVRFSTDDIALIEPDTLSLHVWNSEQGLWTPLPTSITSPTGSALDSGSQNYGTAVATIQELGYIALIGEPRFTVYTSLILRQE